MLKLTPAAGAQVRLAMQDLDDEGLALRLAAKSEGDGSLSLGMGFDLERDQDLSFVTEGVVVLVSPVSQPLLEGAVLDFVELAPERFEFVLRAAVDSTGCDTGGSCGGCSRAGSC
jgi:iron-sulfur cluster assembly protein